MEDGIHTRPESPEDGLVAKCPELDGFEDAPKEAPRRGINKNMNFQRNIFVEMEGSLMAEYC